MKMIAMIIMFASCLSSVFADSCPVLVDPDAQVSFTLTCSNGRRIGSRCNVACPRSQRVLGVASTECQPTGIWSPALGNTQCISALTCRSMPCPVDPCNGAVCPGVPGSACAPDLCSGRCAVAFYANGRRVDKQDCIVEEPCILPAGRPATSRAVDCSFACRTAICANDPDAVCKADCFCRARFYHPKTFEEVRCLRVCQRPDTPPNSGLLLDCADEINAGSVCTISCAPGQMLLGGVNEIRCESSGTWSMLLIRSACVYDMRCPARRNTDSAGGICPVCPDRCSSGEICCPTGCGSTCIPVPKSTCSSPTSPPNANLIFDCTDDRNVGSLCTIRCPPGQVLYGGIILIECLATERWSKSLIRSACANDVRCPARRNVESAGGICPVCPDSCNFGEICCPTGCGSTCIYIR